jgi:Protein of unknown function (DUF4231)
MATMSTAGEGYRCGQFLHPTELGARTRTTGGGSYDRPESMTHEHRDASLHSEHGKRPPNPDEKRSPLRDQRLPKWVRREHDWLEESWKASGEFLTCAECLPGLSPSQRETIRRRWLKEAEHYDVLWRRQRWKDYALRIPLVVLAATVPVLAGLDVRRGYVALAGLGVAILASLDALFQLGERWRQLRQTATLMTREGWCFIELTGPYFEEPSHKTAYRRFLDRLEALNATQTAGYLRTFDGSRRPDHDEEPPTGEATKTGPSSGS